MGEGRRTAGATTCVMGVAAAVVLLLTCASTLTTLALTPDRATGPRAGTRAAGEITSSPPSPPSPPARPVSLDIPAIGVHSPSITPLDEVPGRVLEVPGDPARAGWPRLGPAPGEAGVALLLGHTGYAYGRGIFARLGQLGPGDRISVGRSDGTTAEFVVHRVDHRPRPAGGGRAADYLADPLGGPELRLVTCANNQDTGTTGEILVHARPAN